MYPSQERRSPLRSVIIALIFPGYYYWKDDRKIEGFSLTIATFFGYIILVGYYLHVYLLYRTWKSTSTYNKQYGYQNLTENEKSKIAIVGTTAGIMGHPFFLIISYFWAFFLQLGTSSSDEFQVNIIALFGILSTIFGLRFLLYYSVRSIKTKEKDAPLLGVFKEFSSNNACLVVATPFFFLMGFPVGIILPIFYYLLLPLSFILGFRVIYNNLKQLTIL